MELIASLKEFLVLGGLTSWLIVISGVTAIILGAERIHYLFVSLSYLAESSHTTVSRYVLDRKYSKVLQMCNSQSNVPELDVIKAGILALDSGREAMKSALGATVVEITRKCESRLSYLALIASMATLLGLLGTITGLIKTFAAISEADPTVKAELLGRGISEAMYSTAAGLSVGILAMVLHTLCTTKVDTLIGKSQKTGFDLVTLVEQSERG